MPFVIAIESDRQQAAELAQVVRQRVGAELLLAGSLDEALSALRSRVPDVMLIPALLTSKEDAALTETLREVAGPLAVPILITPTLAVTRRSFVSGGGWPWSRKDQSEEDGCDPAVFAEQLTTYLAQSADRVRTEHRPNRMSEIGDRESGIRDQGSSTADGGRDGVAQIDPEPERLPSFAEQFDEPPPAEFVVPESSFQSIDERLAQDTHVPVIESTEFHYPAVAVAPSQEIDDRATDVEQRAIVDRATSDDEPPATIERSATSERPTVGEPPTVLERRTRIDRPKAPRSRSSSHSSGPARVRSRADRTGRIAVEGEWDRLIASLREAVEGLTVEAWLTPAHEQSEPVRAAQDEWGMYDPDQCAMPAVMRRLEELKAGGSGRGSGR
jgi:hypothetical protein